MRISRSRFDRVARSRGAQAVAFARKDVPAAAAAPVLPVVAGRVTQSSAIDSAEAAGGGMSAFAGLRTTCVRDIFPVLERLQDAVKEMVTDGTRRKAAFDRLKDLIRAGNAVLAIAECVRDCRPNLDRMRDDEYRRRGIPCGSGVIKGGCWTVVVDRLKKSGSRWSVDGANGIMAIRCCWMNNRIVDFLQWRAAT